MKLKFLPLICLLLCVNIFGQSESVGIEEIYLARDNGKGKVGEVVESFLTNDIPIYCVIQLDSLKPVTVKMILFATKVKGVKPETKVVAAKFTTNGQQSEVYFTGKPDKVWVAGSYRIDILIDEKPAKSVDFEIKNTSVANEKEKTSSGKNKSGNVRKLRKN